MNHRKVHEVHDHPARRQSPVAAVIARAWAPVGAIATYTGGSWSTMPFIGVNCDHKLRPRRQVCST
ncbi:MAG: hypothetical protein ACRDWD_08375 [Acidimicrobiia bacterium]